MGRECPRPSHHVFLHAPSGRTNLERIGGFQIKILIVDNYDDIRTMLRRLLELEGGWAVVEAGSGAEGLEVFAAENPELILVDYMMTDMTGVEFSRVLRQDREFEGRIILYSSAGTLIPRAEVDAFHIDVIEKTSVAELIAAVQEGIGH